jgi:glycosyltransferase involved in cell wall biosynthesis
MKKKKVVFLIRDLNYGGAQRQLVTLVKAIDRQIIDVSVVVFYPDGALEKDLRENDINLICLEKRGRWHLLGFFIKLAKVMRQLKPDVLHGYLGEANIISIPLKLVIPSSNMIWGIRDSINNDNYSNYDWLVNFSYKVECFLARFANLIIINSQAGKKACIQNSFPADKIVVIPNGIDIQRFQVNRKIGSVIRQEWKIGNDKVLIGLVGRLDPMKDHPSFLKSAALLLKERQDLHFICIGTGSKSYAQELYQLTKQLGIDNYVTWAGARADMCAVYNALDITVSASAYGEGFPNVIGEAMACGIPCVVTDVGDSAWIVGDIGIVVPPGNPEALAASCIKLITLTLAEKFALQEKSRQKIVKHFCVKNLVETTQLYLLNPNQSDNSFTNDSVLLS